MCDNTELLVGYLYDELAASDRLAFDAHLATCAECREELAGLRSTRSVLTSWAPPEPDFGFRIIRGSAAVPAPAKRWLPFQPAWGLAAAAVLVLAAAAAIANVEVRYGQDGLVMRTGWGRAVQPPAQAAAQSQGPVLTTTPWKTDLAMIDRRVSELEKTSPLQPAFQPAAYRNSDAEIIRRMREMLAQSESRQQQELAARLLDLARSVDRQRNVDVAAWRRGLDGASDAAARRDNQLMQLVQVATQSQQK